MKSNNYIIKVINVDEGGNRETGFVDVWKKDPDEAYSMATRLYNKYRFKDEGYECDKCFLYAMTEMRWNGQEMAPVENT